ncbi:MAG TPA: HEAT repeat domain-containing protein [Kofleriaceae bacterium]|nr:HEAT repeat domain-containing protein [Kofleriaceae bacterium]
MRGAVIAAVALCVLAEVAHAQPADIPGLIKLIETQPADMDRSAWKEKRRDAAKKLVQSKDKRALPELEKLAENETFDIIGEIAIEGLGALGDASAVPTLQKIAGDSSRDPGQRELAKKALGKLGASADVPVTTPPPPAGGGEGSGGALGGSALGTGEAVKSPVIEPSHTSSEPSHASVSVPEPLRAPELPDDTLAAYDRVTFATGTTSLSYDTLVKRLDFEANVAGSYQHRVERESFAYGYDLNASVVSGLIDQFTNDAGAEHGQTRGLELVLGGDGEARIYSGKLYGVGKGAIAAQYDYISDEPTMDGDNNGVPIKFTTNQADLQVAIGGGYGRLLDIGGAIRVRRLARTLDAARALGKPIDAATSKKLQLAWWSLRGERSTYRALVVTVSILRDAGVLLSEPDAGLSYEILNVLRDSWLYQRPSGLDIQVAFGEGYLTRPSGNMYSQRAEQGRVEQVLAQAGYGAQLQDDKLELSGTAFANARLFAPDPQGSPWALGATASAKRFTYGEHGDPFGMFSLTGVVGLTNDGLMGSQTSLHIEGNLGFTYWLNQAGGLTLAASVIEDGGELFLGATLQATYGLLDGTFAR